MYCKHAKVSRSTCVSLKIQEEVEYTEAQNNPVGISRQPTCIECSLLNGKLMVAFGEERKKEKEKKTKGMRGPWRPLEGLLR